MIAEISPRAGIGAELWDVPGYLLLNGKHMRVGGWLMFGDEHPDMHEEGLRGTLWEVRPVFKVVEIPTPVR